MKKNKRKLAAILTGLLVATSVTPSVYGEEIYSAPVENSAENSFDGEDSGFTGNSETVDETNEDVQEITEENAEEDTNQTDFSEEADMFSSDFSDGTLSVDDSPQEELASVGGGFSWGKSYEIIPTDVTSARDGCVLLGVKGTYLADQQNILNKINEIRKEACEEGVPDPRNSSRKLTPADYVPIKWSSDLEYIARIRAAESSVRILSHTRTNNTSCFTLNSPNGIGSYGEVLAWNYSKSTIMGITQWYEEKSAWVSQNLYYETGHYTQMIDPSHLYVGISTFLNDEGSYYNTTAGEFSFQRGLDESRGPGITDCIQLIEVKKDQVKISITGLKDAMNPNEKVAASAVVSGYNCKLSPIDNIVWSSSDPSVASVDSKGNVTAKRGGKTEITATCGSLKASQIIEVGNKIGISEFSVTLSETGYTYDGKEKRPKVTVKNGNSVIDSSNYKVEYVDNVNAGTATVKVTGTGNYSGTATAKFSIFQAHQSVTAVPRESTISVGTTTFIDIKGSGDITCWSSNTQVAEVDAETCLIKGISPGTATITVTAWGNDNYVADNTSFVISVVSSLMVPNVTGVKIGGTATDALRLNWNKNTSVSGYIIEQYSNGGWKRIARIENGNTTTYRVENLKAGSSYQFRIKGFAFEGSTAVYGSYQTVNGTTAEASLNLDNLVGAKIGGRADNALRLNWNKNTDASGYIIEQYVNGEWKRIARIGSGSTTTYRVENLKAGTSYQFRIKAFGFRGTQALYGKMVSVSGKTNPAAVKGLKIGGTAKDALRLNWNGVSGAEGYIIEKQEGTSWNRIARLEGGKTGTYRVEGLKAGTSYQFRIRAFGFDGKTPIYSAYKSIDGKTNAATPAVTAGGMTGVKIGGRADNALRLNWDKSTGVSGYIIEQNQNGTWTRIARIGENNITTYRVEKLSAGKTYQFRIYSFRFQGNKPIYGGFAYISGTTIPSKVRGLRIGGIATDAIRLNWNRNVSASGYIVEKYQDGTWVRVARIADKNVQTCRVEGLRSQKSYSFRICTFGFEGRSALYSEYEMITGNTR